MARLGAAALGMARQARNHHQPKKGTQMNPEPMSADIVLFDPQQARDLYELGV